MPKQSPPATRSELLAEVARAYGLMMVQPDEITADMLLAENPSWTIKRAMNALKAAVRDGFLDKPVRRYNADGRRVYAWRRRV